MNALLSASRSHSLLEQAATIGMPSGAGIDIQKIDQRLRSMRALASGAVSELASVRDAGTKHSDTSEQVKEKLATCKRLTATIAMHLDPDWRHTLLSRLDRLLDPDDWDEKFNLPSEQSFSTFLRMIIYLHPTRRPSIGLSPRGHFLAAWTSGSDRIVIECVGKDEVRWVLSRTTNDGERESGAGSVLLHRVPEVTAPYYPERLIHDGVKILT
jgi:hypothetical protein